MQTKLFTILFLAFLTSGLVSSQTYKTETLQQAIRSLRVRYVKETQSPTRPFLVLTNGCVDGTEPTNTLDISFDCMTHDLKQYSYTVYHLGYDYRKSDLQSLEYIQGFTTADITDYAYSNLTAEDYIHYQLTFPNEDMHLLKSGNYVLHVYEDGNPDNGVADICFQVVEPKVTISATVRANTDIEFNGRYQQLDMDINTQYLDYNNTDELTVIIQQNNRTDNQVINPHINYVEAKRLRYKNNSELIFEGGNEYRHFDSYSPYYAGYNVNRIRYGQGEYHAFLETDENRGVTANTDRTGAPYVFEPDMNGKWIVNRENSDYADTDAEYMNVHWHLPMPTPFFDGNVYVGGDLFNNQMTARNRMIYDNAQHCYYLIAPFKQGAYEYQYWFLRKGEKHATLLNLEGSHWQTENEYTVLIYYRPFGERYDQLIGLQRFSSVSSSSSM